MDTYTFRTPSCSSRECTGPCLIFPPILSYARSCSQAAHPGPPKRRGTALCPASVSDFQSLRCSTSVCVCYYTAVRVSSQQRRRATSATGAGSGAAGGRTACRNGVDDLSSSPAKFPARLTHWSRFRLRGRALPRGERSRGSAPTLSSCAAEERAVPERAYLLLLSLSASR